MSARRSAKSGATSAPMNPSAWMRAHVATHGRPGMITKGWAGVAARGNKEDRTCDRCRVYVPPTSDVEVPRFFSGIVPTPCNTGGVIVGLCKRCAEAEGTVPGRSAPDGALEANIAGFMALTRARWAL